MKKEEKMSCLSQSVGTYNNCKCFFKYSDNRFDFYILDYSEKLMLCIPECDFAIDGYEIRKISDLKKVEVQDNMHVKICKKKGLLNGVKKPDLDMSSWRAVFESLESFEGYVIVENENTDRDGDFFYIGIIKKVKRSSVMFSYFDADGVWYDDVEIPFSQVTRVSFGDRYSTTWYEYLNQK